MNDTRIFQSQLRPLFFLTSIFYLNFTIRIVISPLLPTILKDMSLTGDQAGSLDYLELLESYLPQMATPQEIEAWIKSNVDFSNLKSPMQAMGSVMKHFGKLADGNQVKAVLQEMSTANDG